jgi:glutamate-5-semialdehyde dehydrogenase
VDEVAERIVAAARRALEQSRPVGDHAYLTFAERLREHLVQRWPEIEKANAADVDRALARGLAEPVVDRIRLTGHHLDVLTGLTRSVQRELPGLARPGPEIRGNGSLVARRIPRPLGVLLMIYEARATVTIEGALVAVSTANATILRGGSEIAGTNAVLRSVLAAALTDAALPEAMVQLVDDQDRSVLRQLLRRDDAIDVLIPRGSPSLLDHCRSASRIPVIAGGGGVNHLYVHHSADPDLAATVVLDSKLPDPAGCTTLEMVLLDDGATDTFLTALARRLRTLPAHLTDGFTLRIPAAFRARLPAALTGLVPNADLADHDDGREFLDRTLAMRPVAGVDEAVAHIRRFGTGHTEAVVSRCQHTIERFRRQVDAAAIVVNGSLRLHDGPTIGLGDAELAISTGRLHVRGPVTMRDLLTYSWLIDGHGATRFLTPAGS